MQKLTEKQIIEINEKSPMEWQENEQGVFLQPFGVSNDIDSKVIYMRWEKGGVSGGSCFDSSNPQFYTKTDKVPEFESLDLVLKEVCPNISYLQYKDIEKMIIDKDECEYEYYGNYTEFGIRYIELEKLYNYLKIN